MKILLPLALAVLSCGPVNGQDDPARDALARHGCATCHEVPGFDGPGGITGPPLTEIARQVYVAGVVPNTPENLVSFIRDPQAVDPRSAMPNLSVTEAEAWAIARFLLGLEPG